MMSANGVIIQVLQLNQVTIGKLSIGHIVNLASNDVQRMDLVCILYDSMPQRWASKSINGCMLK